MTDMEQMLSALDKMSERQRENLREMRLQTIHQEHIARQSENVALILTVLCRLMPSDIPTDANVTLASLVKDFQRESMQWREHVERLTSDES